MVKTFTRSCSTGRVWDVCVVVIWVSLSRYMCVYERRILIFWGMDTRGVRTGDVGWLTQASVSGSESRNPICIVGQYGKVIQ